MGDYDVPLTLEEEEELRKFERHDQLLSQCNAGYSLESLVSFCRENDVTAEDIRMHNCAALRMTCFTRDMMETTHDVEKSQWLVATFDISAEDVIEGGIISPLCFGIERACCLSYVQFLVNRFNITTEQFLAHDRCALLSAFDGTNRQREEKLILLQWLFDHFGLTLEDHVNANDAEIVRRICEQDGHGFKKGLVWLIVRFGRDRLLIPNERCREIVDRFMRGSLAKEFRGEVEKVMQNAAMATAERSKGEKEESPKIVASARNVRSDDGDDDDDDDDKISVKNVTVIKMTTDKKRRRRAAATGSM